MTALLEYLKTKVMLKVMQARLCDLLLTTSGKGNILQYTL